MSGDEPVKITFAFLTPKAKDQLGKLFPDSKPGDLIRLIIGQTARRMADNSPWFILNVEDARIVMTAIKGTDYTEGRLAVTNVQEKWGR